MSSSDKSQYRKRGKLNDTLSSQHKDSEPLSLRERKKRLVQSTIEETALQLFQQKGYEQTSIQDIADAVMMSSRTFFRYFASKEEVIFAPLREVLNEGLDVLQHVAPDESPHAALRETFLYLARRCQQQRSSFLLRYQIAVQTPSVAGVYLTVLVEAEMAFCDALKSRLEAVRSRHEVRFLVGIFMTALRVALEEWLGQEVQGDLISVLREYLDDIPAPSEH
jgi:AcrR family transcriptional regulator